MFSSACLFDNEIGNALNSSAGMNMSVESLYNPSTTSVLKPELNRAFPSSTSERRTLRVVHVVLSLDVGGLERAVIDLAGEGRRRGWNVEILCVEKTGALSSGLAIEPRCVQKGPGLRPSAAMRIRAELKRLRPDVVHTHQLGAIIYAGPAAASLRIPVVHTEHGKHFTSRRVRLLGRLFARFTGRFLCVSRDIADDVAQQGIVPAHKIGVVPNGIDLSQERPRESAGSVRAALNIPQDAPVVGTVGRLTEVKRQDLLLRGFATVLKSRPDAHLLIVGDGPMRDPLRRLAEELGIKEQVRFAGYQSEPRRWLTAMDVFCLTSRSEGMPIAVLEAWEARVPVVVSNVGGLPELIGEDRNGLVFPFEDEGRLAAAILRLLSESSVRDAVIRNAAGVLEERYSLSRTVENYEREYRTLLDSKGTSARN